MVENPQIQTLKSRLAEIEEMLAGLQDEAEEIEVALRVLERYAPKPEVNGSDAESKLGPPRPAGTPTLFEMTEEVIKEAMAKGKTGLKGREIVSAIGSKYWPGVQNRQILPPIYGFAKRGRLRKTGSGYFQVVEK